ncbi:MAG: bifunctional 5,10-methylenetetrahydrofolate dehydrogenase/5,10-methenyltetrahydrofolate cyclohydrolase [bacterium]|nr:bifunctional 5,10-methylenetetrahydrofolate dehydrogenase/5,10-methenyltetrahydrofolate cyclohydrolase [bacterium]
MADARVLLGRPVANQITDSVLERCNAFEIKFKRKPRLGVVTIDSPASQSYLKTINSTCGKTGCEVIEIPLGSDPSPESLAGIISPLNDDPKIDGILVQTPLPKSVTTDQIGSIVDRMKDIDGITPYQAGLLFRGSKNALVPPTARAVMEILGFYRIGIQSQEVIIVGRSLVVGKPLGILMLGLNATVTWCHSRTLSLSTISKRAAVLVAAIGKPNFIDSDYVRPGATVIDVGINVDEHGTLLGDVDMQSIDSIAAAYTPVPGGVGPVTSACLFANLLDAAEARMKSG